MTTPDYRINLRQQLFEAHGEPASLDELFEWIIRVVKSLGHGVDGLSWNIRYREEVSNSHHAPIGGVTNWRRYEVDQQGLPLPRGYPGFTGRIWIRYARGFNPGLLFGSEPLETTLTYTGTGGNGLYDGPWSLADSQYFQLFGHRDEDPQGRVKRPNCYSWDYKFFLEDFPALAKNIEHEMLINMLADRHERIASVKTWTSPAAQSNDDILKQLALIKNI
jgi:hypothetical protein